MITNNEKGSHVARSKVTVEAHTRARIDLWEKLGNISAKTAERYRELLDNQIVPHIGSKRMQKLLVLDIETWQAALLTNGRKDGNGGLSAMTIRYAHRLLSML